MSHATPNPRVDALVIACGILSLAYLLSGTNLAAQVQINNTGSSGSSGILMTEGTAITTPSGSDSIYADSTSHRIKLSNNGNSPQTVAVWPCAAAGCLAYASSASGFPETALAIGASGVPLLGGTIPQWGGANLDLQATALVTESANDTTTGTTVNKLAKVTSTGALKIAVTDTTVPTYVVASGAGTSGNAQLAVDGQLSCTMDATASSTAGLLVVASTATAGDCSATSNPGNGVWVVGQMVSNSTTSGSTATILVKPQGFAQPALAASTQAGIFLPMITWPTTGGNGQVVSGTANQPTFTMFFLPAKITVNHISATVTTSSASQTFNVAVYDSGGNKLIDSGGLSCGSATAVGASVGAVILQPGTYYVATAATDTNCAILGITNPTNVEKMANLNGKRTGTSPNSLSGGSMPSSLGTLTLVNGIYLPIVFIEP